jgi:hypothetical protein
MPTPPAHLSGHDIAAIVDERDRYRAALEKIVRASPPLVVGRRGPPRRRTDRDRSPARRPNRRRGRRVTGPLILPGDCRTVLPTIETGGWVWRGIVPWDKGEGTRPRRGGFRAQAEYVVWSTAGHLREDHAEYLPGWIHVPVTQADKHHITGKPTDLMRELVRIAPRGGLVVDPFAGSGTTGVACIEQGRRFVGIEKTEEYGAVTRARLEATAPLLVELPSMTEPPPALFP